jgi:predicted PilT family ATPase
MLKLTRAEEEIPARLEQEKARLTETYETKIKFYQSCLDELNEKANQQQLAGESKIEELKTELEELKNVKKIHITSVEHQQTSDQSEQLNSIIVENRSLTKRLDELKIAYDELNDEKKQLYITLNELKEKRESPNISSSPALDNSIKVDLFVFFIV